jgi:excisionase family DNA binding protein
MDFCKWRPFLSGVKIFVKRRQNSPTVPAKEALTPAQAGAILGIAPATVRLWEKAGRLTSVRTAGGHRRYRRADVEALAAERQRRCTL